MSSRRKSGGRVVVLRVGLTLAVGAKLQDGGGIARAGGLASKVQKCATEGITEGPCGQRQSFSSSFDFFFFDLLAMLFYHFYPVSEW